VDRPTLGDSLHRGPQGDRAIPLGLENSGPF
jgi:hypothetical protein